MEENSEVDQDLLDIPCKEVRNKSEFIQARIWESYVCKGKTIST